MPRKAPYTLPPLNISMKDVGKNIADLRKSRGLTQAELAEDIGITQTLISDYETGRSVISSEMLIRFARALDTSTDKLLGLLPDEKDSKPISLKIMRRAKEIEQLPLTDQKKVLQNLDLILQGIRRA